MFVAVLTKSAWHAVGAQIGSLLTFVNKTYSGDRAGEARLARSRAPSRSSSSTCCPTGATSTA